MSLKTKKHDQGTTEMFILELEKERSLWNGIWLKYKNRNAEKSSFKRFLELFEMSGN